MPEEQEPPTYFGAAPHAVTTGASFVARTAAHVRIFAGFAVRTTGAWMRASRRVVSLRLERRGLERRRKELQYELGGAAFAEDEARVETLRAALRANIGELERNERDTRVVLGKARDVTSDERSAAARTQIIPPSS